MLLVGIIIIALVGQITGLYAVWKILNRVTDRLFKKQEELLKSVQVMIQTLNLQREDNSAMLLAAQMLRAESDARGIEALPFPDRSSTQPRTPNREK